jgi:tRNA dimethylallyltransferase
MLLARDPQRVIVIVGPTAVGKTRLSIKLAASIQGEIISADSRYLYRGMDIGTAKPTEEELATVPHHMIDIADPDDTWSLPRYLEETLRLIDEIHARKKIPIIVGGTGQYVRALTEGWRMPEFEPNQELRRVLTDWSMVIGSMELHRKLSIIDMEAAKIIDATNVRRTIRALEVIFTAGHRFSELRRKEGPTHGYWIIGLTMERDELYKRVDARINTMFDNGLVNEVRLLLEKGYSTALPSMSAIGYREVV